ncbi:MAG: sugar phosphate isomerase/epimerase family protein [Actinomycetota bacterium]
MRGAKERPTPKLMFSTAPFFRQPLREAFRHISDAGFDRVEVMVTQDPHTQEPHLLAGLAKEFGLSVDAIHAPFLLVTRRVWGAEPTNKIYRAVHLAEEVGAPLVVIHPSYRWQVRFRRWLEDGLAEFSATTGVIVAVENMFPLRLSGERAVRFHATQDLKDLERFPHLVLDTSHAAVAGIDIRKAFRRYRRQIRHVHLSNNAGKGWDSHLPVYRDGVLPLDDFLDDVTRDGYTGGLSLELDLRPWFGDPKALHEVIVLSRQFCERRVFPVKGR